MRGSLDVCALGKHFLPVLGESLGNQASALCLARWLNLIFTFGSFWCMAVQVLGISRLRLESPEVTQAGSVFALSSHRPTFKFK